MLPLSDEPPNKGSQLTRPALLHGDVGEAQPRLYCRTPVTWIRCASSSRRPLMHWYVHVAHFFGGALLANAIPHLNAGICGQPLQSPFSSPPFRGLSSPAVNVPGL